MMREATRAEFNAALARAKHPEPKRMHTRRTYDAVYTYCGREVASKHQVMTRGKVTSETFMVNPEWLP